jgi:hypothetical protein
MLLDSMDDVTALSNGLSQWRPWSHRLRFVLLAFPPPPDQRLDLCKAVGSVTIPASPMRSMIVCMAYRAKHKEVGWLHVE